MPTFIPVTDVAAVAVNGSQAGKTCQFTIAALHDGTIDSTSIDDLLTIFDTWIAESLLAVMCAETTVTNVSARDLTTEDGFDRFSVIEANGVNEDGCTPAQNAVVLTKRTGLSGRSRRGRMYIFGVPQDYLLDVRHLSATGVSAYNTVGSSLMASFVSTDWTPVVVSYISEGAPRVTPLVTPLIALEINDTRLDTQRRRLGRGGA